NLSEGHAPPESATAMGQLGLGTAFVLLGQAAFVLCGYLLHFFLSRAVDPVTFGTYGVIMSVLTWTQNALESGVPWSVRKFLPTDPGAADAILRSGLRWQMFAALTLYILTMILAPWLASRGLQDSSLTFPLRLAFTDLLTVALYTFYRGALNGLRLFAAHGMSLAAYALGKLAFSVLWVSLGYSLAGALVGNILGSVVGWLAALWALQRSAAYRSGATTAAGKRPYSGRTILSFALPTVLLTLAGTFLITVGPIGVKALVADGLQVAHYTAAAFLAQAPMLLLTAFSLTLFPHLSGSVAGGHWRLAGTYIYSAMRYLALVLIPGIALVLGTAPQLITMIYPAEYTASAPLLSLLMISTGLYSAYMVFSSAILAEGRVLLALSIPCALVPVSLLATWLLTGRFGAIGAAIAALLSTAAAVLASGAYVLQRFSVRMHWKSLARIAIASVGVFALTRLYVPGGALLALYYLILGALYVALLVVLGEITGQEIQRWRDAFQVAKQRLGIGA
ncbi:MAG: oligosaccharide flippase family protein, partial [Anaerolineales bacterium]